MSGPAPSVTVVTPFYNTAAYLPECIESVLGQTYPNWEYLLVDNHSTDNSRAIAESYAARDPRIRVIAFDEHLPQVANYNRALRLVPAEAAYCKMVQADDWIFPECLARMIEVAEAHPRVGLVSSYYLVGDDVQGDGLPYPSVATSGREVCRAQLLHGHFFFGTPTSILFRGAVVRQWDPFYEENALHEDTEACYRILETWDFGFVHQVLTYSRVREHSVTGQAAEYHPHRLDKYIVVRKYGPRFLDADEYDRCLREIEKWYFSVLGEAVLDRRGRDFWDYHERALEAAGLALPRGTILRWAARGGVRRYLDLWGLAARLRARFRGRATE